MQNRGGWADRLSTIRECQGRGAKIMIPDTKYWREYWEFISGTRGVLEGVLERWKVSRSLQSG